MDAIIQKDRPGTVFRDDSAPLSPLQLGKLRPTSLQRPLVHEASGAESRQGPGLQSQHSLYVEISFWTREKSHTGVHQGGKRAVATRLAGDRCSLHVTPFFWKATWGEASLPSFILPKSHGVVQLQTCCPSTRPTLYCVPKDWLATLPRSLAALCWHCNSILAVPTLLLPSIQLW